jgi:hypothetical protein
MPLPRLPSDWGSYDAYDKLDWFLSKGVTADDLYAAGESPDGVEWLVSNGLPAYSEETMLDPRESLRNTAAYVPPTVQETRNLGPGITLANPLAGITDFGTKTVSEASGDTSVDVQAPQNIVDYLIANNATIADSLAHQSTFVKTYQNVDGQLKEVDPNSITPQDAAAGNVVFQIGGKTGGPDRERVAQTYVPQGNSLVPVGEGQFYKGAHPDQALFDAAKIAAVVVGAAYGLPALFEAGAAALGGAAELGGLAALGEGAGAASALTGAEAASAGLGSLASNLTVGEAANIITNPISLVTKPVTEAITSQVVSQLGLTGAEVTVAKTLVASGVNAAAAELLGGDGAKAALATIGGTAFNAVAGPIIQNVASEITAQVTDALGIDLSNKTFDSITKGVQNSITSGVTTAIAGGDTSDVLRNATVGFIGGALSKEKVPGTKLDTAGLEDLLPGYFDDNVVDEYNVTGGEGTQIAETSPVVVTAPRDTALVDFSDVYVPQRNEDIVKQIIKDLNKPSVEVVAPREPITPVEEEPVVPPYVPPTIEEIVKDLNKPSVEVVAPREPVTPVEEEPVVPPIVSTPPVVDKPSVEVVAPREPVTPVEEEPVVPPYVPPTIEEIIKDLNKPSVEVVAPREPVTPVEEEPVVPPIVSTPPVVDKPSVEVVAPREPVTPVEEEPVVPPIVNTPPVVDKPSVEVVAPREPITPVEEEPVVPPSTETPKEETKQETKEETCPTGYSRNPTTGKCEVNVGLLALPAVFKNLNLGSGAGGYNANLTQPFVAKRTYTPPPEDYDYFEDKYFQRFGPITYEAPAGYATAPVSGGAADTVSGGNGQDTSGMAQGGLMALAQGGRALAPRYLNGHSDGMADKVPAQIDNTRPAALSDGEFVIPADVVSHLGNGNSNAGAKVLYEMMDRIRRARTGNPKQGKQINPSKFIPR